MKRKSKLYSRPKRPYDRVRFEEEAAIKEEFGLKNKREIWRADTKVKSIRERAKKLISATPEQQKALFNRLKEIGLDVNSIPDVLSLDKRDYLQRRLQTILVKKKLASTTKGARQLIVHRKVIVGKNAIDSPSYIVPVNMEDHISIKMKKQAPKGEA